MLAADRAHPVLDLQGHSTRVSLLTTELALAMGLETSEARMIGAAAYYHDVGKVLLDTSPLEKPGPLTPDERRQVQTHSVLGADALDGPANAFLHLARTIARWHHERYDGKGYPDGLCGEEIPLAARIVAIVDVYDALRSIRPYKPYRSHDKVTHQMICSDHGITEGFDPKIVDAFCANLTRISQIWDRAMLSHLLERMKQAAAAL